MSGRIAWVGALAGLILQVALARQVHAQAALAAPAGKAVAIVNGEVITKEAFETFLEQDGPVLLQVPEATQRQIRMRGLAVMINTVLLDQYLRKNGPPLAANAVDKELARITAELATKKQTLADLLRETHQDEAGLRLTLERMLRWNAYANSRIDDAQVQKYYADNKDFFDGVTVRASHIMLRLSPQASAEEEAKARAALESLRKDIVASRIDFVAAARAHSQCPSAAQGGDLDFIPRKWAVEESFARAAFALKVGDMSGIVRTSFGLHLIKVTDRKPPTPSDFNKIKDEVRTLCVEEARQSLLDQLHQTAQIDVPGP